MLPKTLFTVTGSEQPTDAVARAIDLSRENACHLAVLVIGIALPASATAYGAVPAETWSEEREKGRVSVAEMEKTKNLELADANAKIERAPEPRYPSTLDVKPRGHALS